jgi:hypothetical protein
MAEARIDLREVETVLDNQAVRVPVRVSFHQNYLEVRVNIHGEDGELAAVHDIEVGLVEEKVRLLVRSPLGTLPTTRLLHDFGVALSEDNES